MTDDRNGEPPTVGARRSARPLRPWGAIILSKPAAVLLLAAAVAITAVSLAARLQLRTAFTELLPEHDPAVLSLARAERRVGDLNLLAIGIRSPDRAANLAYAR